MKAPISDAAVRAIAEAIFNERPSTVIEAYSAPQQELCLFQSSKEFCAHAQVKRGSKDGSIHVAVHYPEMAGRIAHTFVSLDPLKCNGHTYRYRADGWGLIWVHLQLRPTSLNSSISANSQKRALAWASTRPELDSPSTWDWPVVARHLTRLRRVLTLAA